MVAEHFTIHESRLTNHESRFQAFDEFEDLLYMAWHFDAAPHLAHDAARIDDERAALDAAHLFAVHAFHLDDVEELARALFSVGEQLERKAHFRLEAFMRLQAVARNAIDVAPELLELGVKIAELLTFGRAA